MKRTSLFILLLLVLTLLPLWMSLKAPFVYWDDPYYLLENLTVRDLSLSGINRIFTGTVSDTYIPLSILSYAVEYHFFGLDPFIYHLNNLLFHLAIVMLIFFFGRRLGFSEGAAFLAALIFGIHPMHVEAVAWVTSRKDLLYTFFFLIALMAYIRYIDGRLWRCYFLSLVAGFLSMLAKPMALSLPLVLILIDWFRGRRFSGRFLWDKLPFFLIVIPIGWLTYRLHARVPGTDLGSSLLTWVWCLAFYLKKFLWPYPCLAVYDIPDNLSHPSYDLAVFIFLIAIGLLVYFRKNRVCIFAFGFFLLNIFYLLRFDTGTDLQVVSDRYMYLPSLGFCLLAGHLFRQGLDKLREKKPRFERPFTLAGCLLLIVLGFLSFRQCRLWTDEVALWRHTIRYNPESITYQKLGETYFMQGQNEQAQPYFEAALRLDPDNYEVMTNLAVLLAEKEQLVESLRYLNRVTETAADYPSAYVNRAVVFGKMGRLDKALEDLSTALELDPMRFMAYVNRGDIYMQLDWLPQAVEEYNQAIRLNPFAAQVFFKRGQVYERMGNWEAAVRDFRETLRLDPLHMRAQAQLNTLSSHQNHPAIPKGNF